MTPKEAKRELYQLKDMSKDIQSVENEIERLMTVATKMTTTYDPINVTGTPKNKMEEAIVKLEDYRGRLSNLILKDLDFKNRCFDIVTKIEGILSAALSQHHLSGFGIAQLEFYHLH